MRECLPTQYAVISVVIVIAAGHDYILCLFFKAYGMLGTIFL